MRACAAHGLKVPEDVSIVGFDDFYPEGFMMPALTTINYPIPTLVEVAIREVLDHLQHRDFHAQRILTPVRLMERQSTRRLSE
ncbi:MAG: putative HTH-type transcriptional repressor ExuR [candidate division BRC1 bacterium ADurb.BinA292]|nr:MAG: putative HTH-type transcriptional repressor ExuR [candidate division BRC1 bacterium ADurb.BinA292]